MKVQALDSQFNRMLKCMERAQEVEVIYIPWPMPLHNHVSKWHHMQRAVNVKFIHEAVALSAIHMFDREDIPLEWDWMSDDCPRVDTRVTLQWFDERWQAQVLCKRGTKVKGRKVLAPLDHRECTIVEILQDPQDGRHHIHVHNVRARAHDEDGVATKWLVDGLVLAGFFPDDRARYVSSVTQSQSKPLITKSKASS